MAKRKRDRKAKPSNAAGDPAAEAKGAEEAASVDRWRPWLLAALCALFVARPLFPSESAAQGDGLPMVMLWLALAIFWLLGVIGRRAFWVRFGWVDAAVGLLIGLHTLAALWAAWNTHPRPAINLLWEWIAFGISFFLARQFILGPREARAVAVVMVAVAVALSGHGLYQYFYELPTTQAAYEKDPDRLLRDAGLWLEPGSPERMAFEKRLESVEPLASFALTNSLAGYLAPWLVIALGIGASSMHRGAGRRLRLWLAVAASTVPIAICLLLTKSRSAYVAVLFGLLLVGVILPGRLRLSGRLMAGITAAGAVLLAVAVAVGGLDRMVWSEASKSLGYRLEYWQATLAMIADHPLAGCGPGHFKNAYTAYKLPGASEEIADPHNFLLEVWATAGTPAMLALVAVLGGFFWKVVRAARGWSGEDEPRVGKGPDRPSDSPRYALFGAVAGFFLSFPLGLMSSAPPGLAPLVLGLPLAVGAVLLFWPWVNEGHMHPLLPAIGVAVLLVNLLAAGGIGMPGVSGTLWLLLALGLTATDPQPRRVSQGVGLLALAGGLGVAAACYASAYSPVMHAQAAMRAFHRDPRRAEEHLREAAAADPLAAEPWKQLANVAFERWRQEPSEESLQAFEDACQEALRRDPQAASAWLHYGDCYFEAFERTGRQEALEKAVAMYQQAVALYPNSALYRARLAVAYRAAGKSDAFAREAARALELDAVTPHIDKKLPEELRETLSQSSSPEN